MRVPRSLIGFWIGVVALMIAVGARLAYLGPIPPPPSLPPRAADAAIPAPSVLLMAASKADTHWRIPHPGPYGVTPMQYYAARNAAPPGQPRIAIMIAGIGYAEQPSLDAVTALPAAISLALTPYGDHDAMIAAAARNARHELVMGLPMQVAGEPAITPGDQALDTRLPAVERRRRLDWALSRGQGYAGVTDAIGLDAPETYLAHRSANAWLGNHLRADGLFLIITASTATPVAGVAERTADILIEPSQGLAAEQAALSRLAAISKAKGSALGVLTQPTTRAIAALAVWCGTLAQQGIALVPASALAAATPAAAP